MLCCASRCNNTQGNSNCHVILRGGKDGPNYSAEHVDAATKVLSETQVSTKIMIDCSHGNANKIHTNQPLVAESVAKQLAQGNASIFGVMIESNLVEGNQVKY